MAATARKRKKAKQAQRREGRAVVRQWQHDDLAAMLPSAPPPPVLVTTASPPIGGGGGAVRVVSVKALDFQPGVFDPHWRYCLEVTSPVGQGRRDLYELRYSDVAGCEDVEASLLPGRHLVPWLGKLMDSRLDTEVRATRLFAVLKRLDESQLKRFLASLLLRQPPVPPP